MPWHRSDDRFPEHPKCDALAEHFGDDWATLHLAFALWHHMGCDCAARRTDGVFNAQRCYRIMRAPREAIDAALAGLVKVGLLDKHRDGVSFHDWAEYQPTRAELDAERAAKTERQQRWRENRRGKTHDVDGRVDASTGRHVDGGVDASVDAPVDGAPSRPVPTRPVGETTSLLSPAPPAPPTLPLALTPPAPPAEKPARAKRPKVDKPPPPFSVAEALGAIASTAGGRFVPGERSTWTAGWNIAIANLVRRFPDLALWRRVGAHLAAGGGWARPTLGPEWASSDGFVAVVNLLPEWERRGSQVVDARFVAAGHTQPVAAPTASQPHAPRKVFFGDEFKAAVKAAREDA